MKYRNNTTEFEVWQWKGYNNDDREGLYNFLGASYKYHCYNSGELVVYPYRNQPIYVSVGDYIVKDTNGYFFPIPQDMFETLFEQIK